MAAPPGRNYGVAGSALLTLAQPADWAIAFAGVALVARLLTGRQLPEAARGAAALATALAGTYVAGTWLHRDARVLARPHDPLAQRHVSTREVKWWSVILLVGGIALAATLGLRAAAAAALAAAVMLSHPFFLERVFLARNVYAAAAAVLPLGFAWAWEGKGGAAALLLPAAVAALMAAAASFFADAETAHADDVIGARTVARRGGRAPILLGGGFVVLAAAVAGGGWFAGGRSRFYLVSAAAVSLVMVFYTVLNLRRREPDPSLAGSTARMIKFLVFVFFFVLYAETYLPSP